MTQLDLLKTSGPRERNGEWDGRRENTSIAAGSRRRSVEGLRRGPQMVYDALTDQSRSVRTLADDAGLIRKATMAHLEVLVDEGLAIQRADGWCRT